MSDRDVKDLSFNVFETVGDEWMLLCSGDEKQYNAMTVSWGHFGCIWDNNSPTAVVYCRPQRYTKEFIEKTGFFSLSVMPKECKKQLAYMGSKSGRDEDKIKNCGLEVEFLDGLPAFKGAKLVFLCKVVYIGQIKEDGFKDKGIIERNYPYRDFHSVFIGKIIKAYEA